MRMSERIRSEAVCHPRVADGLLALLLFGLSLVISYKIEGEHPGTMTVPVMTAQALIFALLCFRSIWPFAVLGLTALGTAGLLWHLGGEGRSSAVLAVGVAMVSVAVRGVRRTTVICAGLTSAVIIIGETVGSGRFNLAAHIGTLLWVGFFGAVGEAVQSKHAYVAAIEERARRAEHTRDEEARRRVAEERLRIAQELHDVVAHHIAVIHVQASVAEHLVSDRPAEAKEALTHVRRSSRVVLDELTGLLNVLRQPGESKTPIEPAAGVDDLPQLIHSFESSGLRVSWTIRGDRRPLPPALDLVAYRLVQEGLTNAHKHGSGTASLDVLFSGEAVSIDIRNAGGVVAEPMDARVDDGALLGGYGLIGMRERALAVGGSLRAAPEPDGSWRVRARLPVRPEKKVPAAAPAPAVAPAPSPAPVPAPVPVLAEPAAAAPAGAVEAASGCAADLRKLPLRLSRSDLHHEPSRGAVPRESV